jgi:hypothetical protein
MKLFVYLSENRERAVILFRKTKHTTLQILWDVKLGTFQEGQWLTSKSVYYKGSRLSPDGNLFMYQYSDSTGDHLCVSTPPYFTAKIYAKTVGRCCKSMFTRDNIPVIHEWVRVVRSDIPYATLPEKEVPKVINIDGRSVALSETGSFKSDEEWEDCHGRSVTTDGPRLLVWGEEPKSFENAEYTNVKPT